MPDVLTLDRLHRWSEFHGIFIAVMCTMNLQIRQMQDKNPRKLAFDLSHGCFTFSTSPSPRLQPCAADRQPG